ncbi:MAG: hypothetical protein NC548_45905, partial [Lachnospiraceae bacterium]|nr:hypothetical protein [Lachnospiraceae bacterium]
GDTDTQDPTAPVTDETEGGDDSEAETDADEKLTGDVAAPEETEETAERGQSAKANEIYVQAVDEEETGETTVKLNVPLYDLNSKNKKSFLSQVWYAIGEGSEFQRINIKNKVEVINIPAKAGEKLLVKLVPLERVQIEEVMFSRWDGVWEPITPEDAESHIYAIDIPEDSGTDAVYQINVKADFQYALHFVDVYASKNPDADPNKSVAFYRHVQDEADDGSETKEDLIGQTLELSGQEMRELFANSRFELEVQEGYTFHSIDSNSSGLSFKRDKSYYENGYEIDASYNLGAEDITVFVLAEKTKQNHLKFNIPAELKDKVRVTVTEQDPAGTLESRVDSELEDDDAVWIDSDRKVSFDVTTTDLEHTVRATCAESGGDAVALPYDYRNEQTNGWKTHFELEDADVSMKNGDVTVDMEEVAVYPVEFHPDWSVVDRIHVYEPCDKTFKSSDEEEESYIIWAAEGEKVKFTLESVYAAVGTFHVSTAEDGSGKLQTVMDWESDEDNAYIISPMEPTSVYMTMTQGYEYRVDYEEGDFSVKVCDENGNPIELSADHTFLSTSDGHVNFRIMVKPNSGKWTATSVTYDDDEWSGGKEAARRSEYDDEDGYLCYMAEGIRYDIYYPGVITIEGYNTHTIAFTGNAEAVGEGIWLNRYEKDEWDGWNDWNYIGYIDVNKTFTVKDEEEVYFTLGINDAKYRLNLSLSGSSGQLEVCEDEEWDDSQGTLYHFTATGDATITAELTERQQHTVTISKGDEVTAFGVSGRTTRPAGESGDTGAYLVRDGEHITISGITGAASTSGYRGKVVCETAGKSYEVPMQYNTWIDDDWYTGAYFELEVTSDMTLIVDLVATAQPTVTFAAADKLTAVTIWESGKKPTEDNLYDSGKKEAVLSDDKEYRLDFQLEDGYAAQRVIWKDKRSGEERVLEIDTEDEYRIYDLGVPQGDAQIVIDAVAGYTVQFEVPAGSDIAFNEDISDYCNEITTDRVQVIATDSFPFTMTEGEGRHKLTLDSDAFTLEQVLKRNEDGSYYQYVLKPVAGAELPKTVTVRAEAYAKHTVTLEYPAEIKTIYLLDDDKEEIDIDGKQAEVQGTGTILGVKAVSGYAAKVSVEGKTSGESRELTPFRLAEGDVSEYYLGELSEDVTVTVTAERSTQKLTYYIVIFHNPGNGVKIRDAATKTLYRANEGYDDEGEGEYPYSILKGSSISFTVEPVDGYEVDGVYANGEVVRPVKNVVSQQDIYTVVPMADTRISVQTSKIADKYPLTFTYPEAVQSVKVAGYELTDRKLEVKAGTKLKFAVELADTKHRITSVAMNGKEAAHEKDSGIYSYSITTIAAPMEVVITVTENIDKKVTFRNTVTHMLYSVVTSDQVTESGTDTYTVGALADALRFTVTSAKKESIPSVSYVNATGSETVLQAKTKQESETTIAYTYEIAVAELAETNEVVIGETSTASAEDKAKLQALLEQYKDVEGDAAFRAAYARAQEIAADPAATQTEVENAAKALQEAYQNLPKPADKTALNTLIAQYEAVTNDGYTAESWKTFTDALAAAKTIAAKADATQAEVDSAKETLETAYTGLRYEYHEGLWIAPIAAQTYTGAAIKPEVEVYNNGTLLELKKDYTVTYKNNTNAGTATVTVKGKGNFKSSDTAEFKINKKNIGDEDITVADVFAIIDKKGKVKDPKPVVKFGKKTLKVNNDYRVSYPTLETVKDEAGKDQIVAKDYTITIETTAVKKDKQGNALDSANYTGSTTITYTVCANDIKQLSKASITLTAKSVDYADRDDETKRPTVKTVKISGKEIPLDDLDIRNEGWEQAGKATITIEGKDKAKYYGSKSVTYDVKGTKLTNSILQIEGIEKNGYEYTGEPVYINDEAADPDKRTLKVTNKKTGELLKEGTDYTVSYKTGKKLGEHTNAGTVTVTITGANAYTGSVSKTFKITPVDLATFQGTDVPAGRQFTADASAKYTKTGAKPAITAFTFNGVDLVEKQDYTLSYKKNTKVDPGKQSATMTVKGKGNFKGQIRHTYEVTTASWEDVYATAVDIQKPTKLNQVKSTVKVYETSTGKALKAGTDYDKTVAYYSDEACTTPITEENFATAAAIDQRIYAKVTMKGNYAGTGETPGSVTTSFRV